MLDSDFEKAMQNQVQYTHETGGKAEQRAAQQPENRESLSLQPLTTPFQTMQISQATPTGFEPVLQP